MKSIDQLEKEINSGRLPIEILNRKIHQLNELKSNLELNKPYYGYLKMLDKEALVKLTRNSSMNEIVVLTNPTGIMQDATFTHLNNTFRL